MASFNKVILVGNLTRDPELKYLNSGTAVCEIGMAVTRTWFDKQQNQRREETTFVDVTLWGKTAEVAGGYLKKGSSTLIEGRLQLEQWDDKATGKKRSKLKVVGENMTMLGGGNRNQNSPNQQQGNQQQTGSQNGNDEDVPF